MSNPNPAFIIVPSPFGSYSGQRSQSPGPTITRSLVSPGVAGGYQYITNGPANINYPSPSSVSVGR
jgi:hypothetical protein